MLDTGRVWGSNCRHQSLSLSLYRPGLLQTSHRLSGVRTDDQRRIDTFTFAVKLSFTRLRGQSRSCSHVTGQNWIKTWRQHNSDSSVLQWVVKTICPVSGKFSQHMSEVFRGEHEPRVITRATERKHFSGPGPWSLAGACWQEGDGHG